MPSPVIALTGCRALNSPSLEEVIICVAMWPFFSRSTLLSTMITGLPMAKTRWAMKRSPAPTRSRALSTNRIASTSAKARSTVSCMRSVSESSGRWKPGRSTSTACQSSPSVVPLATPKMRLRVVCGLSLTIATLLPQRALTRVDLPTLGRPATAMNPLRIRP